MNTSLPNALDWSFPLLRPHAGIPLGNGVQGLMVWGEGRILRITVGRAGFWDHRGGNPFLNQTTFPEVKSLLQAHDEAALRRVFGQESSSEDRGRPHQIGGGRLEITLPEGWTLTRGVLNLHRGEIQVEAARDGRNVHVIITQSVFQESARVDLPETLSESEMELWPSWHWVGKSLASFGCQPPWEWSEDRELGFEQALPEDDPLALLVCRDAGGATVGTCVGADAVDRARAMARLAPSTWKTENETWWTNYWREVPRVCLPDPDLQEMVEYGLYMQACATPPHGIACTLQGPFLEEIQIPPWSCDYHFNINIEMIYTPALATNRASHLQPLWALLRDWLPQLRKSGEHFFGASGALMLPHAVDDRCGVVGTFWTGSIDHACTAWVALLCWDTVRYTADAELLRDLAFPLLKGAFEGYWAMCETKEDGSLCLPVTVSPEFKGARMDAWGVNASFQLAAAHAVAKALPQAADKLGQSADDRWRALSEKLPPYTAEARPLSVESPEKLHEQIILWEGQALEASHRHHSHLAGIVPFRTLDPMAGDDVLDHSIQAWMYRGAGAWSGWCVPWAASIHAHCGNADAAVHWLHHWKSVFNNEGRGSLHDGAYPGVTTLAGRNGYLGKGNEIMQLDGRFGALTAVLDLLVQEYEGELRILPRLPRGWQNLSFSGVRAPGAFLLDAEVLQGELVSLRVECLNGGALRLLLPSGERIVRETSVGERLEILGTSASS
ncbi:MAG: hypothetical protein JJU29_06090 [Verrucomicrobia bacterium]|nr:hypothetical protein [Verrucomicrobiota bacterium]MCH8511836.1 hypothetical protein [Kiritimatiellia bacterium]